MTISKIGKTAQVDQTIMADDINSIFNKLDGTDEVIDTVNDLEASGIGDFDKKVTTDPIISGPSAAKYNTTVTLTASESADAFGETVYYKWTLPDDSIVNGDTLNYTMPDNSHVGETVTIKCEAYDILGNENTVDHTIEVTSNAPPVIDSIDWSADPPHYDDVVNYDVTINAHDPESDPISYNVTCDDSNVTINQDSTNSNIFHITYPDYGAHKRVTYTFEVSDSSDSNNQTQDVLVYDGLPIGDVGVFGGGSDGSYLNIIDYITISSPGNATDFGDMTVVRYSLAATSNGTNDRGVFGGGYNGSYLNTIDYITISSPGNATDFGDMTVARNALAVTSNATNDRGVFGGGSDGSYLNTIDYITISSPGNATDFGDLTVARNVLTATSNATNDRGVFGGGHDSSSLINTIDYITISSPGNATDFGDLTVARNAFAATSNGTNDRGVFGGGHDGSYLNIIDYITISSPGNATDFGDMTVVRSALAATSNGTNDRGVFGGGSDGSNLNIIDYITISSPGNATDFGDLTVARNALAATSNA